MKAMIAATAAFLALAVPALAQPAAPPAAPPTAPVPPRPNALVEFPAKAKLAVTTPGWAEGGDIGFQYTQYRTNTFPGLNWSAGPAGTKSYVVIMQDTDPPTRPVPVLHWTLYNVPATVTKLDAGMAPDANPPGSAYGPNARGAAHAYMGPRTPPGPKHHYHLQVFALDTMLADPGAAYDGLVGQMKDHILASGEVVGMGQADPDAPPPPPRPAAPPPTLPAH